MSTPPRPDLPAPPPPGRYGPPPGFVPPQWARPPRPPSPPIRPAAQTATVAIVAGLVVALVVGLVLHLPLVTINGGQYSVDQMTAFCASGTGELAQGFSNGVTAECNGAGLGSWLLHVIGIAGLVVAAMGAMWHARRRPHRGR